MFAKNRLKYGVSVLALSLAASAIGAILSPPAEACGGDWDIACNAGNALEQGAHDAGNAGEKALHDAGNAGEKALHDIGNAAEKALHDYGKAAEKAMQDLGTA